MLMTSALEFFSQAAVVCSSVASSPVVSSETAAAVVSARRAGTTCALDQINKYFLIKQMPVIASRYWSIRSWDGFQIPKPFCKLTVKLGDPIRVPPDLDADGIERCRQSVEDALRRISVD